MLEKIQWKNHSVLGNLSLDLTKSSGTPYKTIVLAGENGVGKTNVLESLCNFLTLGPFDIFDFLQYQINGVSYKIWATDEDNSAIGFHRRKKMSDSDDAAVPVHTNRNNNRQRIDNDIEDIRHYGCTYTKAKSGFKTNKIQSSTTSQLDNSKYEKDENDDYTSVKQLIVDLNSQDNSRLGRLIRDAKNPTEAMQAKETMEREGKLKRFAASFNSFFDRIKFIGVNEDDPNEKRIEFEKNGKIISIDKLSTGEKQIVFRGAYLLRNSKNLRGGIVLIDEPELSMHPKWQEKILSFYRNLFSDETGQFSQIIIATHSEYVIKSALEDKNNTLVYSLSENRGAIEAKKIDSPLVLPTITFAETNYLTFGIPSHDYHIELYGYLQVKFSKASVKDADDFIANHSLYNPLIHSKPSSHGSTTYQTLSTYIRNAIDHPDNGNTFTQDELNVSIQLLKEILT